MDWNRQGSIWILEKNQEEEEKEGKEKKGKRGTGNGGGGGEEEEVKEVKQWRCDQTAGNILRRPDYKWSAFSREGQIMRWTTLLS